MNLKTIVQETIFASKWLLIPFYMKLFYTLGLVMYHFIIEGELSSHDLMNTLEAVDIVMIANLVKMIITGSYHSFVDKNHGHSGENVSSGMLKVKMSSSIIGVSSVHLLKTFIDAENLTNELIQKQLIIHGAFLVGCFVLALVEYLHVKSDKH